RSVGFRQSTIVVVGEADNVILAKIRAALNFNEYQRGVTGIHNAVFGSLRDQHFVISAQSQFLLAESHKRLACDNDPMLAATIVHLKAQAMSRDHLNTFHLVTRAFS